VWLGLALLGAGAAVAAVSSPLTVFMVIHRAGAEADEGFRDYLAASGLPVEFIVRNVQNDSSRVPAVVAEIKRIQPDLIYTQSTMVTTGVAGTGPAPDPNRYVTDIPLVFAMVSRPLNAGLAPPPPPDTALTSGRNLTGAIHVVPRQVQLNAMQAYLPVDKLAVVYDPSQRSQREMFRELQTLTRQAGIELIAGHPLDAQDRPDPARIEPMIADLAAQKPDLLYIPPVNFFAPHSERLTGAALQHRLPTFCAIEVQLQAGGMMGLVAPFYQVGRLAGSKAEQILRGQAEPGTIPIETLSRFAFIVNLPVARELNLYPPMALLRYAQIIGLDAASDSAAALD